MKKHAVVLGVLGILFLLTGVGVWWWLFGRGASGVTAAAHLPAETLVYAELANGTRSWLRYQQSGAKRILEHEEMKALGALAAAGLAEVVKDVPKEKLESARKAGEEFLRACGGLTFFAVTRLEGGFDLKAPEAAAKAVGMIAGFHGSPSNSAHVDAFFKQVEAVLGDEVSKFKRGETPMGGTVCRYLEIEAAGGLRLCHARHQGWDLFSLGEEPLRDFLASVGGADVGPRLAQHGEYRDAVARLDPDRDGHVYLDFKRAMGAYTDLLALVVPAQSGVDFKALMENSMAQVGAFGGLAWDIRIDGAEIRERVAARLPAAERAKLGRAFEPQDWKSLRFTRADTTVLYVAQNFDLESYYDQQMEILRKVMKEVPEGQPILNIQEMLEGQAKVMGFDLRENVLKALGPELVLVVDWPQGAVMPEVLVLLEVEDEGKFKPAYTVLENTLKMMAVAFGHAEDFDAGGIKGVMVHPSQAPMISPTVAVGSGYFMLALSGAGAKRLVGGEGAPLEARVLRGGQMPPATSIVGAYVDAGALSARAYAAGRPFLIKVMAESGDERMKAWSGKLPEQLQVAPLLGRWSSLGWVEGDWAMQETRSPLGSMVLPFSVGVVAGLAVPAVAGAKDQADAVSEFNAARQVGIAAFAAAEEAGGHYPPTLEVLLEKKWLDDRSLLVDAQTGGPRWIYHGAGLRITAPAQTVLLESVREFREKGKPAKVVYQVGNSVRMVELDELEILRPAAPSARALEQADPIASPPPAPE
jgi:hypothetical protein